MLKIGVNCYTVLHDQTKKFYTETLWKKPLWQRAFLFWVHPKMYLYGCKWWHCSFSSNAGFCVQTVAHINLVRTKFIQFKKYISHCSRCLTSSLLWKMKSALLVMKKENPSLHLWLKSIYKCHKAVLFFFFFASSVSLWHVSNPGPYPDRGTWRPDQSAWRSKVTRNEQTNERKRQRTVAGKKERRGEEPSWARHTLKTRPAALTAN